MGGGMLVGGGGGGGRRNKSDATVFYNLVMKLNRLLLGNQGVLIKCRMLLRMNIIKCKIQQGTFISCQEQ